MLALSHLCDLLVDPGSHPRGLRHLSAASSLVRAGPWLYLVADDEHHLGMLEAEGSPAGPVRLLRILSGDLPQDKDKRKARKPDLEALALLPPAPSHPHGALLALGSGSRTNRQHGFLLKLDATGGVEGDARNIDLAGLYRPLRSDFSDLNIEGAFVTDGVLRLLQRANKADTRNACIDYALADVQEWITGRRNRPPGALSTTYFALGEVDSVPLGFTDGLALPGGGWIFSAVAEDTADSTQDGACTGSVIGWVNEAQELQRLEPIAGAPKVEGIALAGPRRLWMVTDSDDPATASALWSVDLG